jgi:hypothetical protein
VVESFVAFLDKGLLQVVKLFTRYVHYRGNVDLCGRRQGGDGGGGGEIVVVSTW